MVPSKSLCCFFNNKWSYIELDRRYSDRAWFMSIIYRSYIISKCLSRYLLVTSITLQVWQDIHISDRIEFEIKKMAPLWIGNQGILNDISNSMGFFPPYEGWSFLTAIKYLLVFFSNITLSIFFFLNQVIMLRLLRS